MNIISIFYIDGMENGGFKGLKMNRKVELISFDEHAPYNFNFSSVYL